MRKVYLLMAVLGIVLPHVYFALFGMESGLPLLTLLGREDTALATTLDEAETFKLDGAVYYVDPSGSNSGPGTESQPWRTIQKAADTMVAGDTVYIKTGTYRERVVPQHSGSAGNYIVYAAYPGSTVTIDGANITVPDYRGLFDITDRDYIRISGLRIVNAGPGPYSAGILVRQGRHIIIEDNYIYNTSDSGIGVWYSEDVIIDNNEVEEACYDKSNESITVCRTDGFEIKHNLVHHGFKEGIDAKDGSRNGKIYGNHVHHMESVNIYVDAYGTHAYNIEVFNNIVHDSPTGLALASEQGGLLENVKVYNNVSYSNLVGLYMWDCCGDSTPIQNVQIVNNTFYDNGRNSWGGGILLENPEAEDVIVRNNICSENFYFQICAQDVPSQNYTVDHNLIDGFRGNEGEIYGDDYVEGDPRFIDPVGADFHLQGDSPAIDNGSSQNAPSNDFDGQQRPVGAGYDIGADEYTASTVLSLYKDATPDTIRYGDILTYELTLFGPGLPASFLDPLPPQLRFVPGSLTSTLTPIATYDSAAHAVYWAGTLPLTTSATLSFQVTLATTSTLDTLPPILNTAWLIDTLNQHSVKAFAITNARHFYLPLIMAHTD